MYIEFDLPNSNVSTYVANQRLSQALVEWSEKYNIPYTTKLVKLKKRVTFNEDRYYEFFILTWTPKTKHSFWLNYRVIRDLNNKL
jgi:hypothetical protein